MVGTINPHIGLPPTSNHPCWAHIKSPSANAKGLEIVRLPLVDGFRTFCWGEIMEELRNIYKLKELIGIPANTIHSVNC
jgi:hypothetical protein